LEGVVDDELFVTRGGVEDGLFDDDNEAFDDDNEAALDAKNVPPLLLRGGCSEVTSSSSLLYSSNTGSYDAVRRFNVMD
jgi:hypothetical protein